MSYHEEQPNPIIRVGLSALPGEWQLKMTGEEYVGIYHLHEDGIAMAGSGVEVGDKHDIIPEKVIVERQEEEEQEEEQEDEAQEEEEQEE